MKGLSRVSIALVALVGSEVRLYAADTGASTRPDPHKYKSYDYTEADHKFRLVVPEDLAVVRWWSGRTPAATRATTTNKSGTASS
jgi:hypothetical protein